MKSRELLVGASNSTYPVLNQAKPLESLTSCRGHSNVLCPEETNEMPEKCPSFSNASE